LIILKRKKEKKEKKRQKGNQEKRWNEYENKKRIGYSNWG
jgi:hypothetical protein